MSLQTNNTSLQTILDTVNALPDAGSGSSAPETCTVTIDTTNGGCTGNVSLQGSLVRFVDGEYKFLTSEYDDSSYSIIRYIPIIASGVVTTLAIENVVVGSIITISADTDMGYYAIDSNCALVKSAMDDADSIADLSTLLESPYEKGPIDRSEMLMSRSAIITFKILGDTTISIWDED